MDSRPNLENLLTQWPMSLSCHCSYNSGPEQDCPEHGDVKFYAEWAQESHLGMLRLAHIAENLRQLADKLCVAPTEREREIGLEILQRLAQDVDLKQHPQSFDPWGPGNDPEDVPF
jgi:hypothetical protein